MSRRENEDPEALGRLRLPFSLQEPGRPAALFVDGPCDGDCVFCSRKTGAASSWAALSSRMDRLAEGVRKVCVVGNEPLAQPDILRVLARCRELGAAEIEVMTSGQRLADASFARAVVEAGATAFSLPLHAARPRMHDALTGVPGAFRRVMQAILTVRRLGAAASVHANLVRFNAAGLPDLERLVAGTLGLPFAVVGLRPKSSRLPYAALAVRLSEAKALGLSCLAGFPLCVAPPAAVSDSLELYLGVQVREKPPGCRGCAAFSSCPGVFREYLDLFGARELEVLHARAR